MNPEYKQKWIDALRSNKYKQAFGQLCTRNGEKCCAVGVLCFVMDESTDPEFLADRYYGYYIPDELQQRAELTNDQLNAVMQLNDRQRKTLYEIAGYVERNF